MRSRGECQKSPFSQRSGRLSGSHSLMSPSTTTRSYSGVSLNKDNNFLTWKRRSAGFNPRCVTITRMRSPSTSISTSSAVRGSWRGQV